MSHVGEPATAVASEKTELSTIKITAGAWVLCRSSPVPLVAYLAQIEYPKAATIRTDKISPKAPSPSLVATRTATVPATIPVPKESTAEANRTLRKSPVFAVMIYRSPARA
jgi:hypothetical protein